MEKRLSLISSAFSSLELIGRKGDADEFGEGGEEERLNVGQRGLLHGEPLNVAVLVDHLHVEVDFQTEIADIDEYQFA